AMAATIMGHELILEALEGWLVFPGWGRARDPLRYAVTVFGDPGTSEWGWPFAGHRLSLHSTITRGQLASPTPSFFGAGRAESPLPGGAGRLPRAAREDLGGDRVGSLEEHRRAAAVRAPQRPPDIATGNRPMLAGRLWVTRPSERFRDPAMLPRPMLDGMQ